MRGDASENCCACSSSAARIACAIAGEAEILRRIREPVEMQLEKRVGAVPEHGLDEEELVGLLPVVLMRERGEKLRLQQALAKLLRRIGVDDDAAAGAHSPVGRRASSSVRMATLKTVCCGEKKPMAPV